jgi:hypothetical protein
MKVSTLNIDILAHDVATTSGTTLKMISENPEVMAVLAQHKATLKVDEDAEFTLSEHVTAAMMVLTQYNEAVALYDGEFQDRRKA